MINDNSQFEKYFQMKNGNKRPITNGNENLIRKRKSNYKMKKKIKCSSWDSKFSAI